MDEGGVLSNRADEFLDACREAAHAVGRDPESFAPECAKSMVEVNTPPVRFLAELAREYPTGLETGPQCQRDPRGPFGLRPRAGEAPAWHRGPVGELCGHTGAETNGWCGHLAGKGYAVMEACFGG